MKIDKSVKSSNSASNLKDKFINLITKLDLFVGKHNHKVVYKSTRNKTPLLFYVVIFLFAFILYMLNLNYIWLCISQIIILIFLV